MFYLLLIIANPMSRVLNVVLWMNLVGGIICNKFGEVDWCEIKCRHVFRLSPKKKNFEYWNTTKEKRASQQNKKEKQKKRRIMSVIVEKNELVKFLNRKWMEVCTYLWLILCSFELPFHLTLHHSPKKSSWFLSILSFIIDLDDEQS